MANLKSLHRLESLYLSKTKVTDAGLEILKDIHTLEYLDLYNTDDVSYQGVDRLQRALPNCWIFMGEPDPGPPGLKENKGSNKSGHN